MGKFALLIGISEYEAGLSHLPAATKDTVALQRVLKDSALGGFDEVKVLDNPSSGEMAQSIELWVAEREADDLVLFFFSGHGVKDDRRELYFAAKDTQKVGDKLMSSTAVSAQTLHNFFRFGKPQKQVIILDCCFSGAFGGLIPRDDGELAFQEQLAAQGRVVLTSTSATGYAFEEKEQDADLSIYTRYLIEGLEKGTAVMNGDGFTTVGELHKFANRKVRETAPAMHPKIITLEGEGYDIQLARTPKESPALRYRKAVEKRARARGEITSVGRRLLKDLSKQLKLGEKEAAAIEAEVLQPFIEYRRKLAEYREALTDCLEEKQVLDQYHVIDLKDYQKYLSLKDSDVQPIERELLGKPLTLVKGSGVAIVPGAGKKPDKQLLLLDMEIARAWGCRLEDVCVYQEETLAEIEISQIDDYRLKWPEIDCVLPSELFLPELKFIDHMAEAIPGGLMPESAHTLTFMGELIVPLLPISPLLLEYFTPEDLVARQRFRLISGNEPQVEVSLDLPLTGMRGASEPKSYRLTHVYSLKVENALDGVPVLEIWPNFQAVGWRAYYGFFFDSGLGTDTFRVAFPESVEVEIFQDSQGGHYSMTRMDVFPSSIECLNQNGEVIGLILLPPPPQLSPHSTWQVGVDFGNLLTNIYVGRSGIVEPLVLDKALLAQVIDSPLDTRFTTLFEYFLPKQFVPAEQPLPLASILTTRGSNREAGEGDRAILDGRIYVPNLVSFRSQAEWLETELKWNSSSFRRLFLQNLILLISANAVEQGAKNLNWRISYPLAFSSSDRNLYVSTWTELLKESALSTGISHRCSLDPAGEHFRTENMAVAQYFVDKELCFENQDITRFTCIEIGGRDISNISIWQNNVLLHQCSVKLAGSDLLFDFLQLNPTFISKLFDQPSEEWTGLTSSRFHAKLYLLLRWESKSWLDQRRPTLTDSPDMVGLIRLMALGVGGLYYYVGLLIKALRVQGIYTQNRVTPVYLGGNGSCLLHWIDSTGHFTSHSEMNLLLSRMLSRGANVDDTEEDTRLSSQPKDEVASGLVLETTKLTGVDSNATNEPIAGEAYLVNGQPHNWDQQMVAEDEIESIEIPSLDNLNTFLYEFHKALQDLHIEGTCPLPSYELSIDLSDNAKIWQGTKRSLDKILAESGIQDDPMQLQIQPPFILGLKALLRYLGQAWADENQ